MSRAIEAIIERNVKEATSLVIEGTHLVPGLSPLRPDDRALVIELVLAVRDEDDHRENFAGARGARTGCARATTTSSTSPRSA
jgi:2-phosphoglycerate kinase